MPRGGRPFAFAKAREKSKVLRDGGHSSMVEPQIVVLAVAGSSPVGHPAFQCGIRISLARPLLNENGMILTSQISHQDAEPKTISFWQRLLEEEELRDCAPLEKLLAGCEIIAALDRVDLLAA